MAVLRSVRTALLGLAALSASCYVSEYEAADGEFVEEPTRIDIPVPAGALLDVTIDREIALRRTGAHPGESRREAALRATYLADDATLVISDYHIDGVHDPDVEDRQLALRDGVVTVPEGWPPQLAAVIHEVAARVTRTWADDPLRPEGMVRSSYSWLPDVDALLEDPISAPLLGIAYDADETSAFAQVTTLLPLSLPLRWGVELHVRMRPSRMPSVLRDAGATLAEALGPEVLRHVAETEPEEIRAAVRANQRGLFPAVTGPADRFETVRIVVRWPLDDGALELEFVERRHRRWRDA